jgi:hydrogenase-4 component F
MLTGFLSLLISSVFISRVSNYKRMLAYSSIENMGIMFIGVALGPQGIFAALLHTLAHSLSKASLFLTSGNIVSLYGTKRIDGVQGLLQRDARSGWLWIASMLSIIGIPPSPIFISKFLLLGALWQNGFAWLAVPFFILTVTAAFGLGNSACKMAFGGSDAGEAAQAALTPIAYVPQVALLLVLWIIGADMPAQVLSLLTEAARFFK